MIKLNALRRQPSHLLTCPTDAADGLNLLSLRLGQRRNPSRFSPGLWHHATELDDLSRRHIHQMSPHVALRHRSGLRDSFDYSLNERTLGLYTAPGAEMALHADLIGIERHATNEVVAVLHLNEDHLGEILWHSGQFFVGATNCHRVSAPRRWRRGCRAIGRA